MHDYERKCYAHRKVLTRLWKNRPESLRPKKGRQVLLRLTSISPTLQLLLHSRHLDSLLLIITHELPTSRARCVLSSAPAVRARSTEEQPAMQPPDHPSGPQFLASPNQSLSSNILLEALLPRLLQTSPMMLQAASSDTRRRSCVDITQRPLA